MTTAEQSTAKGWMPDDSSFGARLALIRQRMGWGNVREAATQCGIPPESWRTWERDGVEPRRIVEMAALISDRTGCDYGWLLAGPRLRGASEAGSSLKRGYESATRSVDALKARPVSGGPFSGGRRDSTRPVSSVPATRRRPQVVSTPRRPKTA